MKPEHPTPRKRPARQATLPSPPPAHDATTQVLRHFRSVFNAVKTHFQQVEKKAGIGGAQVWALSTIAAQPGLGVKDLAMAMDIHQTTASNLVKGLLQQAYITAEKKGADRRAVQLYLLPAGQAVLKKAPGPFAGVLPEALSQLDAQTLQRMEQDLGALLSLIKADAKAGARAAKTPLAQL